MQFKQTSKAKEKRIELKKEKETELNNYIR